MRIFSLLLLFALVSPMAAFEVSPMNPNPGDAVTIRGVASPGEEVRLRSSFEMDIPVVNGKYEYVATGVQIPQRPNRLSVAANNVDDLKVGVRMGIWVTMPVRASGGVASVSKSEVPPGRYTLKIFGEALPGATTVSVRVDAETAVRAGSDGSYQMVMDTSGVPEGKYNIRAGGDEKVVMIGRSPVGASRYGSEPTEIGTTSPRRAQESPERGRLEDAGRPTPIPEPYYREMKRGDSESPEDLVRYFNAARNRAENLDVFEKAAFYEHYLTGCGFNVSFAYCESFGGSSQDHLWLLMMTKKGEAIDLDPSYRVKGASSLMPLEPRYSRYDHRFEDIYEAAETLGVERLAWWTDEIAWGSPVTESSLIGEEAVKGSEESAEERPVAKGGFISWIRDLLTQAFAKIGLAVTSQAG
ncbi:MAG: hypothetical protein WBK88_01580 [Methanothrix sp.]